MIDIRSDLLEDYESIRHQGEQFPEPHDVTAADGLLFEHPEKGLRPIKLDLAALALQDAIYSNDQRLRAVLSRHNITTYNAEHAAALMDEHLSPDNDRRVWGFSGYATGGINPVDGQPYSYDAEARGLRTLFGHLRDRDALPGLAIDGGVSEGFLALSSIVARSADVPTAGFLPRQGLASAGVRDHLIIAGNTYQQRETALGTADVLVCAGGAAGTARECSYAVRRGAAVLLLNLTDYPASSLPNTFHKDPALQQAYRDGRLIVAESSDDIAASTDRILDVDTSDSRPVRNAIIQDFILHS